MDFGPWRWSALNVGLTNGLQGQFVFLKSCGTANSFGWEHKILNRTGSWLDKAGPIQFSMSSISVYVWQSFCKFFTFDTQKLVQKTMHVNWHKQYRSWHVLWLVKKQITHQLTPYKMKWLVLLGNLSIRKT